MLIRFVIFLFTGAIVLFAGCASAPETPAEGAYEPPAATGAPVASIKGSRILGDSVFDGEHTGSVFMIDMKLVAEAQRNWKEPIMLTPGGHDLTVVYLHSNFRGQANVKFVAAAGANYQLLFKGLVVPPDNQRYCEFWIVDLATSAPVTEVHRSRVSGGKTASTFAPQ